MRRKVALTHGLDRWAVNPIVRAGHRIGIGTKAFALLETTGRRTGKRRVVPVGNGLDGDAFWIVAQDGHRCAYVANLIAEPRVRVKVLRQPWRSGIATVVDDADGLAVRAAIDARNGVAGRLDGRVFRLVSTELLTVRIDLD